jgi:hypothetical protein
MQILKEAGIDRCKRRWLSKLYMDQIVISMTTKGRQEVLGLEEEFNKDAVC